MKREQIEALGNETVFGDKIWNYVEIMSWLQWYPDLFLDLITPERGGIKLHLDQRVYLRCIMRFVSTYGVFPRGWGKCVKGDTLIYTENGIKEIGEIFDYNNCGEETYYDTRVGVINRYGQVEQTALGLYNGKQKTITITTNEGYSITGTYHHPILVMNRDGKINFKKLEDIDIDNDYIIINRKNNLWGNNNNINREKELSEWVKFLSNQSKSHLYVRKMPHTLNKRISRVLGCLIGDGCLTIDGEIIFTNKDKDLIDLFIDVMSNEFQVPINKIRKVSDIDYRITDKYLKKYLELIGMYNYDSHNKVIPKCILESSRENIASFVSGLFDTDGTVDNYKVSYCTVSEKLCKQLQAVLLNFGIISSIKIKIIMHMNYAFVQMIYQNLMKLDFA